MNLLQQIKNGKGGKQSFSIVFWLGLALIVLYNLNSFMKGLSSAFKGIGTGAADQGKQENDQNHYQAIETAIVAEQKKKAGQKPSFPPHWYTSKANELYSILDDRNYITGSYDNLKLRTVFYGLQNTLDFLLLEKAFGTRPFTYGFLPPRTANISLIDIGTKMDKADAILINKRFQEKNIQKYFNIGN